MRDKKYLLIGLILASLVVNTAYAINYGYIANQVNTENIRQHIEYLSNLGSRVTGYPGEKKAALFIEGKLRQLDLDVKNEEFNVTVPIDKGASLEIIDTSNKYRLYSLWPNGVRTSTLPEGGMEGLLIYGGKGEFSEFNDREIKGKIVLLDFNSRDNWLKLAMLGAKAVIFIQPEKTVRLEAERKFLRAPLSFPRFYLEQNEARQILSLLKEKKEIPLKVRLKAKMDWEEVSAKNIFALIEGRDPALKEEIIVIQAYYDAMSVVPGLAPGAENAVSISTLLEMARILKRNPPARSVLILANSAHFMGSKGISAFVQKHSRTDRFFEGKFKEPIKISLFLGLGLSSHSEEIGVWHNSADFYHQRYFAPFAKKFCEDYAIDICAQLGYTLEHTIRNGVTAEKGIGWSSLMPGGIKTDAEIVLLAGNSALSFVTVHDVRNFVDTPLDKPQYLNYKNINKQSRFLSALLSKIVNDSALFPKFAMALKDELRSLTGTIVRFDPRESFVPDAPLPGAIAEIQVHAEKTVKGVRTTYFNLTDIQGKFIEPRLRRRDIELHAYVVNENGEIVYAPDRGVNGDENYPMTVVVDWWEKEHMIVLFPCVATNVYELMDPRYLTRMNRVDIFNLDNSIPFAYGFAFKDQSTEQRLQAMPGSLVEPVAVLFSSPQERLKLAFGTGALGMRQLLINAPSAQTKELSEGKGFAVSTVRAITNTPFHAAMDMHLLNEFRMRQLHNYGIANRRLDELHEQAGVFLEQAKVEKENKQWDNFIKFARRSAGIESRAYPDVKGTTNDVVQAIIFYLFLLLPFAYLSERLLIGFVDIKKQILGAFGIFLGIYAIMRFVHPAFRLTFAPEIILLAFILLALSIVVIFFVGGKFEELMKKRKREIMKVHEIKVSRTNVLFKAFSLGVSNMRRRKMRTVLTSITLILLTFTVLSFTSVRSYMRFYQVPRPNKPAYQGMLVRDRTWFPLEEPAVEYLKSDFADEAIVSARAWYITREPGLKTFIKVRHQEHATNALGALGLLPEEKKIAGIEELLVQGRWFAPGEEYACIIPDRMAKILKIKNADVGNIALEAFGNKFTLIGIIDSHKFNEFKDLDEEPLTPVDFLGAGMEEMQKATLAEKRGAGYTMAARGKIESFLHLEAGNVFVIPYQTAINLGGTIQSVAVKFQEGEDVQKRVEDFVSRLALTIFAGIKERVSVYSSLGLTSFSGLGNLFIPILIAALIVLNTMMGSVYERFKEIGTYSSVGLAPLHISSLFIAEACVYAIIGGIAGYLVGQVIAKGLTITGALSGLTLNYSSLSAVSSTMLVMAVVLLSTIYPARQASRMAVPDVTRKWTIPSPAGDQWKFDFPFTVSEVEVLGLFIFLRNYFASYTEESIGTFYTEGTHFSSFTLPQTGEKGYFVKMDVWLSPFDLGVSEKVELRAAPTQDKGIYLIEVHIDRLSGEVNDWVRLNRHFLDSMRKQFLIWRTVPEEVKFEYRQEGETLIK